MLRFLGLAGLVLTAAAASRVTFITSVANLTAAMGNTVRITDTNGWQWMPAIGDWSDYKSRLDFRSSRRRRDIQNSERPLSQHVRFLRGIRHSCYHPDPYPTGTPRHSSAAIFSLVTVSGSTTLNIIVPAINKPISIWSTFLADLTVPLTVTTLQAGARAQMFTIAVIGKVVK
ncbi:hypothetical protein B0H13DRAFT_2315565 [Mycena leptocephala]|nr:hypothetical protein B0H13DRAFT_2315565 [Mycena leptocephala]